MTLLIALIMPVMTRNKQTNTYTLTRTALFSVEIHSQLHLKQYQQPAHLERQTHSYFIECVAFIDSIIVIKVTRSEMVFCLFSKMIRTKHLYLAR